MKLMTIIDDLEGQYKALRTELTLSPLEGTESQLAEINKCLGIIKQARRDEFASEVFYDKLKEFLK